MAKMTLNDFCTLLQIGESPDENRRKGALFSRINGLGLGTYCNRCGGSGHYSFNAMNGTTCFRCGGSRYELPKLTDKLYKALEQLVAEGKLQPYLEQVRARVAMRNACKGAVKQVMDAWTNSGVSGTYKWQLAAQGEQPHKMISDDFNKPMSNAYEATSKASSALDSLSFKLKKCKNAEEREALDLEIAKASENLVKVRDEALKLIADLSEKLKQLKL